MTRQGDSAYPDTCVGTDSHTTMINGLGVLGWGVGGIEAEAAMLGQPVSMLLPEVIGFRLTGKLKEGVTATDLVLTVTQMLRKKSVVGKFVEFFGEGLSSMTLADRATIGNMAPEYGATCGFFPVDGETIRYMENSGRDTDRLALVEAYCKTQGMWREEGLEDPIFTDTLELDLGEVVPSMAGPKRPEGRVALGDIASSFAAALASEYKKTSDVEKRYPVKGTDHDLGHGDVAIAADQRRGNQQSSKFPSPAVPDRRRPCLWRRAMPNWLGPSTRTEKPWVKAPRSPPPPPASQVVGRISREGRPAGRKLEQLGFKNLGRLRAANDHCIRPIPGPLCRRRFPRPNQRKRP